MQLPKTFEEISEEIVRFTDLPGEEVRARVWAEALTLGANAGRGVRGDEFTPHVFDERMEKFYQTTDAFIFECLVFWARPDRQLWIEQTFERLTKFAAEKSVDPGELKILILGDGVGSDSLYLISKGMNVDYFDVPGSRTFDFAVRRFEHYGAIKNHSVNLVADYAQIKSGHYDVLLNFEVLEHLTDPLAAVADIARFLKPDGIALVTEAFDYIVEHCPTHLESNRRYSGRAAFMFRKNNLNLQWYSRLPLFKPMEFRKQSKSKSALSLLLDKKIFSNYINNQLAFCKVRIKDSLTGKKTQKFPHSGLQKTRTS